MIDDPATASLPVVSGMTAAAARAAGVSADIVPAHIPDHFHAHVAVAIKERLRLTPTGHAITIEHHHTVTWISPDTWVQLVAAVVASAT